ncbi:efflux RND transporter periplasmic adaptor subunit [Siphonobacter sp. SORGH_AS_0500]|uniref:efflux RND transporter periplasmic adaptor subunit n=1 Tax=Siphonobacter sp. SORGH_AS_0500 TaxID=1864824 RepID=UPI0028561C4B|nr:efflux RND transporter periplasmic adaptor subunit [Siphonobacter sp. SORGH_AS_0500]MDR6196447.1 membrane fusion protein (multidrug efflux system) [Siphonobacter sp. SORGH_AS_0500]
MKRLWIWLIPVGLLALFFFVGILPRIKNQQELHAESDSQKNRTTLVNTVVVKRAADTTGLTLPGQITPYRETQVYARTQGFLRQRFVDIGSKVRRGSLLATIDAPELDQDILKAQADLKLAQSNLDRVKSAGIPGAVSQQDIDNRQAGFEVGRATLQRLQALKGLQQVRAPFNGIVTARNADVGALINTGNISLFTVSQLDTLRVYIDVPQTYYRMVAIGLPATVKIPELGKTFTGKVVRTSGTLRSSSRTLLTEVAIPNHSGELVAGLYGQVTLDVRAENPPVRIPANTLLVTPEGPRVIVVSANHQVKYQPITIGRDFGTSLEILEGLQGDERLVTNPSDGLKDGQIVRVK